jgi:hypothetical protein
MRKLRFLAATLGASVFILSGEVGATTITTTSFSTWSSSGYTTGSSTLVDLSTQPSGTYNTSAGLTVNGYIFTGPDGGSWQLSAQSAPVFGSNKVGLLGGNGGSINTAIPGAGNSAIFIDAGGSSTGSLTLVLSDGESFTGVNGTFGVSISHPITSFLLTATSGSQPFLGYVYFGTSSEPQDAQPTIEGATLILISGGLLVIFGFRRKLGKRSLGPEYSRDIVAET